MLNSRAFRFAIWVLMIFVIILVGSQISFIFRPLLLIVKALFFPVLLSGLLYYWFFPLVDWLHQRKVSRTLAIVLLYCTIISIFVILFSVAGPILQRQISSLISDAPRIANVLQIRLLELQETEWAERLLGGGTVALDNLINYVTNFVSNILTTLAANITPIIGVTTSVITTLLIVPFILFYMLLDGHKLPDTLVEYLPARHRKEARSVLRDMDHALSSYIQGQALVSLFIGILALIGYLVIGLDYALILALVATITNVVPLVGPIIGTAPAIIVGLISSPGMALRALIIMIVIQQLESMFISPRIMGKKLSSHPVTIILVILAAGKLAGFLGILLAIPAFAVLRVIISHVYSLVILYREPVNKTPK